MLQTLELLERDGVTLRARHRVEGNPFYGIAEEVGCCKLFHPDYMHAYWTLLGGLRGERFTLLELGVEAGRSLRLWELAFPLAVIEAADCDPECVTFESDRSRVSIGRQEDPEFLAFLVQRTGPLTVVIDDASHVPEHQLASLLFLWEYVVPGGWYVCEDFAEPFAHGWLRDWSGALPGLAEMHYYPDICFLRKRVA